MAKWYKITETKICSKPTGVNHGAEAPRDILGQLHVQCLVDCREDLALKQPLDYQAGLQAEPDSSLR